MDDGSRQQSVEESNKQELQNSRSGERPSFLHPSLSLQGEIGMEGPHSLLAMCASVEKQIPLTIFGKEEETAKGKINVVTFQTMEIRVAVYSSRDEDA